MINPKWKGKIVSLDPRDTGLGATMQFYYYSPEIGPEFMKKFFGGMEITYAKNFRQMTDWLAQGQVRHLHGLQGFDAGEKAGLAGGRFRYQSNGKKDRASPPAAVR